MPSQMIRDLNSNDKPRERLINFGAQALSDPELLAIILRSGGRQDSAISIATQMLKDFGSFRSLAETDIKKLINYKHIGKAKACGIKAAYEISLRIGFSSNKERVYINKPKDIFDLLRRDFFNKKQEYLFMISLDSRNKYISKNLISVGTLNETLIHPREIFKKALETNASTIALAHNHPSGDPTPSDEDINVTERIAKLGIEMGIPLLDHVVTSEDKFLSIKSLNLIERG